MKACRILAGLIGLGLALGSHTASAQTNIDLTSPGDTTTIDGAIFTVFSNVTTVGTGVIDPFLRTQFGSELNGNPSGQEQGYNTDGALEFETKAGLWTHALLLSDVPTVEVDGVVYREFVLDINEPNGQKSLISLSQLVIFQGNDPLVTGYDLATNTLPGTTQVYDMDQGDGLPDGQAGGVNDVSVTLDYSNFSGSGRGLDLILLVPDSVFDPNQLYVFFFNEFGHPELAGDGFEEWAVKLSGTFTDPPGSSIPEPATFALLLSGLLGLGAVSRRRRRSSIKA